MIDLCVCPHSRLDFPGGDPHCRSCGLLVPVETDEVPSREVALLAAHEHFPARPIVLHHGSFADDHALPSIDGCWCLPETIPPWR